MKAIAGLGNPGAQYQATRHNIGFEVVDQLSQVNSGEGWQNKFDGLLSTAMIGAEKVLFFKPMLYMNRSGLPIRKLLDFYKIPVEQLLVVCDDFSLPLGRLRFRPQGSAGGQNGLKDIFQHLGGQAVPRLRVGLGDPGRQDPADFVLSAFSKSERPQADDAVTEAGRAAECWARDGMAEAMNRFNGKKTSEV